MTVKKVIEQDTNKQKHILCSWIGIINIKISILLKTIYRYNAIPVKIPMMHFTELEQIFQKLMWNQQRPHITTVILRKQNKVGGIMLPHIKLYCKAIVTKTAWYWHKNRPTDQWDRRESPEINPHLYNQLIFNRGSKHIQWAIY